MVVVKDRGRYSSFGFITVVKPTVFQFETSCIGNLFITRLHMLGKNRSKNKLSLTEVNYIKR